MTKKELVLAISKDTGISVKDSQTAVVSILGNIIKAVKSNERVTLTGFGVFEKSIRKARICNNPKTGEKIQVGERAGVRFKPGKNFKENVS